MPSITPKYTVLMTFLLCRSLRWVATNSGSFSSNNQHIVVLASYKNNLRWQCQYIFKIKIHQMKCTNYTIKVNVHELKKSVFHLLSVVLFSSISNTFFPQIISSAPTLHICPSPFFLRRKHIFNAFPNPSSSPFPLITEWKNILKSVCPCAFILLTKWQS